MMAKSLENFSTTPDGNVETSRGSDSSISTRQNEPENLRLLAAQRQIYSEGKNWQKVRSWSVLVVAVLGLVSTIFVPALLVVMSAIGALVAVAQWVALQLIRRRTKLAAAVQECFDTTVLDLPWNQSLLGRPDPEDVIAADRRFRGDRRALRDWYTVPADARFPYGTLLAQRTNLRWDSELRKLYATAILLGMVIMWVVIVVVGLVRGLSLLDFVLAFIPSVGASLLGIETVRSHRQHASNQHKLKERIETAWARAVKNRRAVKKTDLRSIQDEIYRLRTLAPPVPDWFYWRHRDQFEDDTKAALASMWATVAADSQPSSRA